MRCKYEAIKQASDSQANEKYSQYTRETVRSAGNPKKHIPHPQDLKRQRSTTCDKGNGENYWP